MTAVSGLLEINPFLRVRFSIVRLMLRRRAHVASVDLEHTWTFGPPRRQVRQRLDEAERGESVPRPHACGPSTAWMNSPSARCLICICDEKPCDCTRVTAIVRE
jgi:hypothetical protein